MVKLEFSSPPLSKPITRRPPAKQRSRRNRKLAGGVKRIHGNEKIYFVNSDYDPDTQSRRFIFEFADMSWVAITTEHTGGTSKYSALLMKKPSRNIRAPKKVYQKTYFKDPSEHARMLSLETESGVALFENFLYNYESRGYSNKQIKSKLATLIRKGLAVTVRIVFELTKSLPKAKLILDLLHKKHGDEVFSRNCYFMEDRLVFDSLSRMTDNELKTANSLLLSLGLERKKAEALIQTFAERKRMQRIAENQSKPAETRRNQRRTSPAKSQPAKFFPNLAEILPLEKETESKGNSAAGFLMALHRNFGNNKKLRAQN